MLRISPIFLYFILIIPSAFAQTVHLHNGDRISGKVQEIREKDLILQADFGAKIVLPLEQVKAIRTAGPERRFMPVTAPAASEQADTKNDPATTRTAKQKALAASLIENTVLPGEEWDSSGSLALGGELQTGRSDEQSISFNGDISLEKGKNRFRIRGEILYGEEQGIVSDDEREISLAYDRSLTEKWFLAFSTKYERDDIARLDLRSTTGAGLGYKFFSREDLTLEAQAGLNYLTESFENRDEEESLGLDWRLDYEQKFFSGNLKAFHMHELDTSFAQFSGFIFDSETGLSYPFTEHFSAQARVDFEFDNDPAPGVDNKDVAYTLSLGYEW